MNMVMQSLTWEACLVFLDDIIDISSILNNIQNG